MTELDRAEISRRIADARKQAGLTQPELAETLGVHFRTVQVWETGQRDKKGDHQWVVPFDRLGEIAEATGVTKAWLLHGSELSDVQELRDLREEVAAIRAMLEQLLREQTA